MTGEEQGPTTAPPTMMAVSKPTMQPVMERERIPLLDVLRGFALLGIFFVNIGLFAAPIGWMFLRPDLEGAGQADRLAAFFVKTFCEYKFVSLFSLLFGVGFAISMERLAARGAGVGTYVRRLLVLAGFGLVHGFFFWYGDILLMYAVIGFALLLFRRSRARTLVIWSMALLVFSSILMAGMLLLAVLLQPDASLAADFEDFGETGEVMVAELESEPSAPAAEWLTLVVRSQFDFTSEAWQQAEMIAFGEGPYLATFVVRGIAFTLMVVVVLTVHGFGPRILAMFLLGMALHRLGYFQGRTRSLPIMGVLLGFGICLPLESFVGAHAVQPQSVLTMGTVGLDLLHTLSSAGVMLGYVGLVTLALRSNFLRSLSVGFAAVGRLALTNYLLQTLIATTLMYWYGLGLYGKVARSDQMAIVILVYMLQICWSLLWLRWFTIGPAEWLWRWLTYGRRPTWRRSAPAAA